MSQMADILLFLCSCRDGVCVWGPQCMTGAPVLVLVQSGMLSAWDSGLPPGFQMYGQADTQQGAVPTSLPQGLSPCLSCRNPRTGRWRRTARTAKPPPLSRRSISERGQRSNSGDSDCPRLSSQHSSACQPHGLHLSSFWGNWEEHLCLGGHRSASWKPLQSLSCLRGGDALSTIQVRALPSPCRFWELGRQRESWSQSWLLPHLPAPAPL